MLHACNVYRVNMKAETFATCTCGWAKSSHSDAAIAAGRDLAESSKVAKALLSPTELRERFVQKQKLGCNKFVVDLQGDSFGQCKNCGAAKADHSEAALAAGEKKANAAVDSEELRKAFQQKQTVKCTKFVVDLNGKSFGQCRNCGAAKADHSEAAVAAEERKQAGMVHSGDLRCRFVKKTCCDCTAYEVDMVTPGVPFGQCVCGEPKANHSDAALAGPSRRSSRWSSDDLIASGEPPVTVAEVAVEG